MCGSQRNTTTTTDATPLLMPGDRFKAKGGGQETGYVISNTREDSPRYPYVVKFDMHVGPSLYGWNDGEIERAPFQVGDRVLMRNDRNDTEMGTITETDGDRERHPYSVNWDSAGLQRHMWGGHELRGVIVGEQLLTVVTEVANDLRPAPATPATPAKDETVFTISVPTSLVREFQAKHGADAYWRDLVEREAARTTYSAQEKPQLALAAFIKLAALDVELPEPEPVRPTAAGQTVRDASWDNGDTAKVLAVVGDDAWIEWSYGESEIVSVNDLAVVA